MASSEFLRYRFDPHKDLADSTDDLLEKIDLFSAELHQMSWFIIFMKALA